MLPCTAKEFPWVPKGQILFPSCSDWFSLTLLKWSWQTRMANMSTLFCLEIRSNYKNNSYSFHFKHTWKLSKDLAGMLSSNSFIISHGPSPTPTKIIDKGNSLQQWRYRLVMTVFLTRAWTMTCCCKLQFILCFL